MRANKFSVQMRGGRFARMHFCFVYVVIYYFMNTVLASKKEAVSFLSSGVCRCVCELGNPDRCVCMWGLQSAFIADVLEQSQMQHGPADASAN